MVENTIKAGKKASVLSAETCRRICSRFYCPKAKLIVEVDGSGHLVRTTSEYDKARDEYLKNQGLKVLRFNNIDVMKNIEGVVEKIEEEIG